MNTINQGLVYFSNSGLNSAAGVQIIYNSNPQNDNPYLQIVGVICEDMSINNIGILYDIQIQG